MKKSVIIDGETLTITDIVAVARHKAKVELSPKAKSKIANSRAIVEKFLEKNERVYGLTTGVGKFKDILISKNQIENLQENLIRSHSAGVGNPFPEEVVRAAMLVRANSLAKGYSGVRAEIVETLIEMLNKNVHPFVPEKGSVGTSGDLAPLAHMVLVMIGEGEVFYGGKKISGEDGMNNAKIKLIKLKSKEALALINGTAFMTAIGALAVHDSENLAKCVDISSAMSLECLIGTDKAFDEKIHKVRPHPGQLACAENMRKLTRGSELIASHKNCKRVQDSYSIRCIPQVHGASRDAINYTRKVLEIEINSSTDNPLIFNNPEEAISGGNFHGQPIAIVMDILGIAIAELANISERRIARMTGSKLSEGLPAYLTPEDGAGLNSGLMITQYTAASLVSENKVLAHPASVDSIPTSANQEDHVSMGAIAARKAREILENVEKVIGIELLCAAQGLDFRKPLKPGRGTKVAYDLIRKYVPKLEKDRVVYKDVNKVDQMVQSGEIVHAVEEKVGKLK